MTALLIITNNSDALMYLGRRLDELLFFLNGGDYRYNTHGLLFITLLTIIIINLQFTSEIITVLLFLEV